MEPSMNDERVLALGREILEELYKLDLEKPGRQRVWQADRNDADCLPRMQGAEYLRDKGLVSGSIGADGGLALRITATGADYVEADGFCSSSHPRATNAAGAPFLGEHDLAFMRMAIEEARKSKAEDERVHPMVGAVVVRDGKVLAKAHRGELEGGEHGEFTVLEKKLKEDPLVGATVYVAVGGGVNQHQRAQQLGAARRQPQP
jgi:hypothetical protein